MRRPARTRSVRPPKAERQAGSRRDRLAVLLGLVTLFCLGAAFILSQDTEFLMPGPLTSSHGAIENCSACHTKSGSGKLSWIHGLVAGDPLADSKACLTCHKMPDTAFNAHGASAAALKQSTERLTKIAAATPDLPPPAAAAKLNAGVDAAAVQAAEPHSGAPLRILLTRRTQRDRIVGVQQILASMGYLPPQNFDGTMGKATIGAVKEFQKANGMRETGAFNDELVKKVYEVAGKGEPPAGHLYVRQDLDDVFDTAVSFRNAEEPLGTHVYVALNFAPGDTKINWVTLDVQDGAGAASPLDRLEIPDDVRQKISERLTPGSTFGIPRSPQSIRKRRRC